MIREGERDIVIVGFSQSDIASDAGACNEVELIMPVISDVLGQVGLASIQEIDFTCSGSCDYLQGAAFAFVSGIDALGAVPPIAESHVEMDAAWALYEAWVKLQTGEAESALVYGFGKSSPGDLPHVLALQLDPFYSQPLWPDSISLAAIQARTMLERGKTSQREMASVVAESRKNALSNPHAQLAADVDVQDLLKEPFLTDPLRRHDCCPVSDGASAMIICTAEKAREWSRDYARIVAIDHRLESAHLGSRDLSRSVSTTLAAKNAGVGNGRVDVAELYAPFSHQLPLLKQAMDLDESVLVNPSGGVLAGNPMMAAGLSRIGEVAMRIIQGDAGRGVAHATSGPCLQQNLVAVLEEG